MFSDSVFDQYIQRVNIHPFKFVWLLPMSSFINNNRGFPGGSVLKNLPAKAGDTGPIPDLGRSHMPWSNKEIYGKKKESTLMFDKLQGICQTIASKGIAG